MIANMFGLLFRPKTQWQSIAEKDQFSFLPAFLYTAVLAAVPAYAWFVGTTQIGWTVADGDTIRMTADSASVIIGLFYFTMVASVCVIGYMIHWMSETYGTDSSTAKGIAVAGFSATPLFIAGAVGFVPVFWAALLIGVSAVSYAVYLLYLGIPIVMGIPQERGFLFSSAVIAFCLVILIGIMGGTVIMWDMGAAPSFTD
ncbi:Yip1 family protein [Oceanicoccus sagamiensis]|uniref:Yip1 domain-containing protein n=1 Tax=Oceanicoccus sagamiensis TaxID=716816 RepID=A0A1X9NE94_9GAMM|nr:Yip1 family protein [Oceanicoccus sagamiensis]ARN74752.1 hypothetical protein BST96_11860 [Oceanicoccus sagamiensis]